MEVRFIDSTWRYLTRPSMSNIHRQIHPVESKERKKLLQASASQPAASDSSQQQLLAGYMAYEFPSRGTLLGHELDPAARPRSEAVAVPVKRPKSEEVAAMRRGVEHHQQLQKKRKSYAEVATDGAHLPWVVNPTQLARGPDVIDTL